jgi:hypothetical protein
MNVFVECFTGVGVNRIVLWEVENTFQTLCLVFSEVHDILFQCGEPSEKYKESCRKCVVRKELHLCSRCNKVGHPSNVCPNIWGKYHSVVSCNPLFSTIFKPDISHSA